MDNESIKCPQCGAAHVNRIKNGQYFCPYCGNAFYAEEKETFFFHREADDFKLSQKIKEEEFKRSLIRNKKTKIIKLITVIILLFIAFVIWFVLKEYYSDTKHKFTTTQEICAFLEAGPFISEKGIITFYDNATKASIDGIEFEAEPSLSLTHETGCVFINHESYAIYSNYNNTKYLLKKELGDDKGFVFERKSDIPISNYFVFKSKEEVIRYLVEAPFVGNYSVLNFADHGNTFVINGNPLSCNLDISFGDLTIYNPYPKNISIMARAFLRVHCYQDQSLFDFYLIMDKKGTKAYLLETCSNKKYYREDN